MGLGLRRVLGLVAFGAIVLLIWARFELRVPQPLVDMRMMQLRGVWTTNVTALMVGFGMFGSFLLIPQFVEMPQSAGFGFGASVTQAGLYLLPSAAVMLVAGPAAGTLGNRFGSRTPLLIGIVLRRDRVRLARGDARRVLADLPGQPVDRRGHRARVRRDGDADRRCRAAVADRRRHGHEHDHALDRRCARRGDRGEHRRRATPTRRTSSPPSSSPPAASWSPSWSRSPSRARRRERTVPHGARRLGEPVTASGSKMSVSSAGRTPAARAPRSA